MNFFDKWFLKQTKKAWTTASLESDRKKNQIYTDDLLIRHPSSTIKMYKAIGGLIVEISSYDINLDKMFCELYIISDTNKLNEELTSILIQHSLKKM